MGTICTKNTNVVVPQSPTNRNRRPNRRKSQRVIIEEREMTLRERRVSVEKFNDKTPKKVKKEVIREYFDHNPTTKSPTRGRRNHDPTSDTSTTSSQMTDDEEVPGNREVMASRPNLDYIIGLDLDSGVYGVGVWFMNRVRIMSGTFTNMCASGIRLSFYKKLEEEQKKKERRRNNASGIRKEKSRVFHPLQLLGHSSMQKRHINTTRKLLPYEIVQSNSLSHRGVSEGDGNEDDMDKRLPSRVLIQVIDGRSGENVIISPGEIVQHHVRKMKQDAKKFLRKSIQKSVAVLPIDLNHSQREELSRVFKKVRLNIMRTITGATAAGLTYGYKNFEKDDVEDRYVIVLNHGYASLNITIFRVQFNVYEVLASVGKTTLGGTYFVLDLVEETLNRIQSKTGKDYKNKVDARTIIRVECENIIQHFSYDMKSGKKKKFSKDDKYKANFDLHPNHVRQMRQKDNLPIDLTFTLSELEDLFSDKYKESMKLLDSVISDSGISKGQINDVVTVGVMTEQHTFQELVGTYFEDHSLEHLEESSIVYGAALLGAVIQQNVKLVLQDVIPFALGVKISRSEDDKTLVVLPKFSPTPSSESFFFQIEDSDEKTNFSIEVVEVYRDKGTSSTSTEPQDTEIIDIEEEEGEEEEEDEMSKNRSRDYDAEGSVRVFNFIGIPEGEKDLIIRVDMRVDAAKTVGMEAYVVEKMERPCRRRRSVVDDELGGSDGKEKQLVLLEGEYDQLFEYPKKIEMI